jgi:hypothetical protein
MGVPRNPAPRLLSGSGLLVLPLVRVYALEVGEHDLPVEAVAVHSARVLHNGVSDGIPVASADVQPTAWARLRVGHDRIQVDSRVVRAWLARARDQELTIAPSPVRIRPSVEMGARMTTAEQKQIAFVLYPGLTPLDLVGPLQALAPLPRVDPTFEVMVVAESKEVLPNDSMIALAPSHTFDEVPSPFAIVVPGGGEPTLRACGHEPLSTTSPTPPRPLRSSCPSAPAR